jgi:protein-tyrosine phosphatase
MPSVLIICTANICRSPMAEVMLRRKLETEEVPGEWQVSSAGTWATDGIRASEMGVAVMRERGLDTTDHRSRAVTDSILAEADLILTMTSGHAEALRVEFPEARSRIRLLSEMAGPPYDIRDPYGGTLEQYQQTARELEALINQGIDRIATLATENEAQR